MSIADRARIASALARVRPQLQNVVTHLKRKGVTFGDAVDLLSDLWGEDGSVIAMPMRPPVVPLPTESMQARRARVIGERR